MKNATVNDKIRFHFPPLLNRWNKTVGHESRLLLSLPVSRSRDAKFPKG